LLSIHVDITVYNQYIIKYYLYHLIMLIMSHKMFQIKLQCDKSVIMKQLLVSYMFSFIVEVLIALV
jgi:hypothetical protein